MPIPENPAYEALDAAAQFGRLEIALSDNATQWVQKLTELQANRPEPPVHNKVAEFIAASAKQADIEAEMRRHLNAPLHATQHVEAERICGQRALAAILTDRTRLHSEMAAIANHYIDRLHDAARIDEDLRELNRQNRSDEAHLLSVIDNDAANLRELYDLRDLYLTPHTEHWATGIWDCSAFKNPWEISHFGVGTGGDQSLWATWRRSIRAGGRLWFPSLEEARAQAAANEVTETLNGGAYV